MDLYLQSWPFCLDTHRRNLTSDPLQTWTPDVFGNIYYIKIPSFKFKGARGLVVWFLFVFQKTDLELKSWANITKALAFQYGRGPGFNSPRVQSFALRVNGGWPQQFFCKFRWWLKCAATREPLEPCVWLLTSSVAVAILCFWKRAGQDTAHTLLILMDFHASILYGISLQSRKL